MNKLLFALPIFLLFACQSGGDSPHTTDPDAPEATESSTEQEEPSVTSSLSPEHLEKIDFLYETFHEVDPSDKRRWIADFERERNPEVEFEIWMQMANAYTEFCDGKNLDLEVRKEVYKIVLLRSSSPPKEVLQHISLLYLTEQQAMDVMNGYTLKANPVKVKKPEE